MAGSKVFTTIQFKHWQSGEALEATGELLEKYNNTKSDRYILKTSDDEFIDIIKSTVTKIVIGSAGSSGEKKIGCKSC
jgi:hypothetical protein